MPSPNLEALGLRVTTVAGALYVAVEILIAAASHSQSVLLDAIFDTAGVLLTFLSVRLLPLINSPPNARRPFGYAQAEPVFLVVKGLALGTLVVLMFTENVQLLLRGGHTVGFDAVAAFELGAGLVDIGVVAFLLALQRTVKTPIFRLEVKTWIVDALVSLAMAAAFFFALFVQGTPWEGLAPYVDPAVVILLSVYVAHVPLQALGEGLQDLVLLAPSRAQLAQIQAVASQERSDWGPARLEVVKTGRKYRIQLYLTPDHATVSLDELAEVQASFVQRLRPLELEATVQVLVGVGSRGHEGETNPPGVVGVEVGKADS